MVKEAKTHLKKRESVGKVIVVGNPEWRPALVGLVANTLAEEYERPVFVWGRDGDGVLKGSCRSYNGYDLFKLMNESAGAFIEFGGHAGAGGFSITLENLPTLEEKLSTGLLLLESSECDSRELVGLSINIADVGENLWRTVSQFAPFGEGNEKPVFKIPQAEIKSVKKFGKEGNHLEVVFNGGLAGVKAISFFSTEDSYKMPLTPGLRINLLAHLEKSYLRNRPELRLRIVDLRA